MEDDPNSNMHLNNIQTLPLTDQQTYYYGKGPWPPPHIPPPTAQQIYYYGQGPWPPPHALPPTDEQTHHYEQGFRPPSQTFPIAVQQIRYNEQGVRPPPQVLRSTGQQTQYYEQSFWPPPHTLPSTGHHTSMQPSVDNRAFGYYPRPTQPVQNPHLRPTDQYPYPHGFGHIQPIPPQQWSYNQVTQSPFNVRDHTPYLTSSASGRGYQHSQVQHQHQPAPDVCPRMEGASAATTRPPFPGAASNQAHGNSPGPASPFPMPPSSQSQRNTSGRNSQYLLHRRGPQVGASQVPTTDSLHSPQIGQPTHPPPPPLHSPPTLRPSQQPGRSTGSARAGKQLSTLWDLIQPALVTPLPVKTHRSPQTERTTRLQERPAAANRSHPSPALSGSHIQAEELKLTSIGGNYNDQRGAWIHNYTGGPESDPGRYIENGHFLDELRKESSLGAISYAEARADAGRCHPGTRANALTDLGMWSYGRGPWKDVKLLILTGPAGHGKSCIMQTFADRLLEKTTKSDPHPVIATFFFKGAVPELNQPMALVTTLAHQISGKCPSIQPHIATVIRTDKGIFSASLEHQMQHLLVNPIINLQASSRGTHGSSVSLISAVDGLDECEGEEAQSRVIRLLHALSKTPNTRVVLASRPEFPIQSVVKRGLSGMLHVDLNKDYDASNDICQFTWVKLLDIRKRLLPTIDHVSWPHKRDAEQIAECASGQFILAEVAMRYVDDRRYDPRERLKEVLALCGANRPSATRRVAAGRGSARPLGALDALFTGILERAARNAYPDLEPEGGVLELTSLVWILIDILPDNISLWLVEEALGRQHGDLARSLSDLHSLLDVPEDMCGSNKIRVHHKSFLDFLQDPGRSSHLGNIPQVAKEKFNQMIKAHLSSLTVNDLKKLVSGQAVEPHILHSLHRLCKPRTVIESIGPKAWMDILRSLSAWETLLLKQWVHVSLPHGSLIWDFRDSTTLKMMDQASNKRLHNLLFPGVENKGPADPEPILDVNVEFRVVKQDGQGNEISGHTFIPGHRTRPIISMNIPSLPWFPAARALAWLWAPSHRLATGHSRVTQHAHTLGLHPLGSSHIVFIIGSAGSGKQELLEQAYDLLPADKQTGPLEGCFPPVDILIVPDADGSSLRSLWTPGSFAEFYGAPVPCNNEDLTEKVDLGNMPTSLFQHWITCWNAKWHVNTMRHPQFLLQGFHLLPPEHQAALLDVILSHVGQSDPGKTPPLFITVTSLPTETLANRLCQFSQPGVFYVNLDGMKADVSLLERTLFQWVQYVQSPPPPPQIRRLAQILAASPKPARHLKRLFDYWTDDRGGWREHLDPILAAPEAEAWRLIEGHSGDTSSDDESGEEG